MPKKRRDSLHVLIPRAVKLAQRGTTQTAIGKQLGVGRRTVARWMKRPEWRKAELALERAQAEEERKSLAERRQHRQQIMEKLRTPAATVGVKVFQRLEQILDNGGKAADVLAIKIGAASGTPWLIRAAFEADPAAAFAEDEDPIAAADSFLVALKEAEAATEEAEDDQDADRPVAEAARRHHG